MHNRAEGEQQLKLRLEKEYWDHFYSDHFNDAISVAKNLIEIADEAREKQEAQELCARILLKQGRYHSAYELIKDKNPIVVLRFLLNFFWMATLKSFWGNLKMI